MISTTTPLSNHPILRINMKHFKRAFEKWEHIQKETCEKQTKSKEKLRRAPKQEKKVYQSIEDQGQIVKSYDEE